MDDVWMVWDDGQDMCGGGFEWDPRRCSEVAGRSSDVIGDESPDTEKDYRQRSISFGL